MPLRLVVLALAVAGVPATAEAATPRATSSNWSGYAVHRSGVRFRSVSASWTVPTVDCSSATQAWSATWVGLGGYRASSPALEQVGTEADCSASGRASYASWYELVPAASHDAHLITHAGDRMTASVAVSGRRVRLRLADLTRGTVFAKVLRASRVDVTSAEWIVEAPSACSGSADSTCRVVPLADFGSTRLSGAAATSASGHRGTILDGRWTATAIDLTTASGDPAGPGDGSFSGFHGRSSGGATAGALNAAGSAFSVAYVTG